MTYYDQKDGSTKPFDLKFIDILFICSILCSSDIIAAVTIVKFEDQPKLFSIILGEGLENDAVAIILYQTISRFEYREDVFDAAKWYVTAYQITRKFFTLCLLSVMIGLAHGFLLSYVFKRMRFLTQSAIGESLIMMCFGMLSYYVSEELNYSGIVSLLTASLIMAHYAWHNLSPQGKHVISVTF